MQRKKRKFDYYNFKGDYRTVGRQHGETLRDQLVEHLHMSFDLIYENSKIQKEEALRIASGFDTYIRKYNEGFSEEILGLSEGAKISYEEALLLQIRQEIINISKYGENNFECTTYAMSPDYTADKKVYSGQNADLSGNFEQISNVICFEVRDKPKIMMVTPAGQISYIGINEEGISSNGNFLSCNGWKKGFPRYLLTRQALESRSFAEACEAIEKIENRSSSRNVLIADRNGAIADYETTADDMDKIVSTDHFVHSNHFVCGKLTGYEMADNDSLKDSRLRRERLDALIVGNRGHIDTEMIKSFLRDHENGENSLCVHTTKEKSYHTFTSTINNLTDLEMEICCGNPCENEYFTYKFE